MPKKPTLLIHHDFPGTKNGRDYDFVYHQSLSEGFMDYVKRGNIDKVKKFMKIQGMYRAKEDKYIWGLAEAAQRGNVRMVQTLLYNTCILYRSDDRGNTALMYAAAHEQLAVIDELILHHNRNYNYGRPGRFEWVEINCSSGCDKTYELIDPNGSYFQFIETADDYYKRIWTGLVRKYTHEYQYIYPQIPHKEFTEKYNEYINRINPSSKTALYYAAANGNIFVIKALLKAGALVLRGQDAEEAALKYENYEAAFILNRAKLNLSLAYGKDDFNEYLQRPEIKSRINYANAIDSFQEIIDDFSSIMGIFKRHADIIIQSANKCIQLLEGKSPTFTEDELKALTKGKLQSCLAIHAVNCSELLKLTKSITPQSEPEKVHHKSGMLSKLGGCF